MVRRVTRELRLDIAAAHERDPAARGVSSLEILLEWPGVQAVLAHRVAHALHDSNVPIAPRAIAYVARALTGVEIHPAANVGDGLFIDHGMGVVIGETADIGDDVTLYQGVTLGGTGFATGKRHPTIGDNVTVGSGAKLLGPIEVGHGAKVGANSVVISDVAPHSTVVGNPGHVVRVDGRRPEGPDADWIHLPDPVADAIRELSGRLGDLERRLDAMDAAPPRSRRPRCAGSARSAAATPPAADAPSPRGLGCVRRLAFALVVDAAAAVPWARLELGRLAARPQPHVQHAGRHAQARRQQLAGVQGARADLPLLAAGGEQVPRVDVGRQLGRVDEHAVAAQDVGTRLSAKIVRRSRSSKRVTPARCRSLPAIWARL
ncbi:serine O-acetyltransferase [Baekduia soli]|uniref:Serine acetyltransferase n=1 Tax=Baekduia soli TaxID=496014 RepID=A0A5B8UCQ3_9ACTN|nr:serine O-acetyltransferase [Baekduia soli]